jgi:hypothetical protein
VNEAVCGVGAEQRVEGDVYQASGIARIVRGEEEGGAADDMSDNQTLRRARQGMRIYEILGEMRTIAQVGDDRWSRVRWHVNVLTEMVASWNTLDINVDFALREMGFRVRAVMRKVAAMENREVHGEMHGGRVTIQVNSLMQELENILDHYYEGDDE